MPSQSRRMMPLVIRLLPPNTCPSSMAQWVYLDKPVVSCDLGAISCHALAQTRLLEERRELRMTVVACAPPVLQTFATAPDYHSAERTKVLFAVPSAPELPYSCASLLPIPRATLLAEIDLDEICDPCVSMFERTGATLPRSKIEKARWLLPRSPRWRYWNPRKRSGAWGRTQGKQTRNETFRSLRRVTSPTGSSRLARLEEGDLIDLNALQENDEFLDTVLQASQVALRSHQEEKREALRGAILNTAIGDSPGEALRLMFIGFVDYFTELHLRILVLFDNPPAFYEREDRQAPDLYMGGLAHILEDALPELSGSRAIYDQIWTDLYQRGLVNTDGLHTTMTGHGLLASRTTDLGKRFLSFIREP